jgi:hypothetical protein
MARLLAGQRKEHQFFARHCAALRIMDGFPARAAVNRSGSRRHHPVSCTEVAANLYCLQRTTNQQRKQQGPFNEWIQGT